MSNDSRLNDLVARIEAESNPVPKHVPTLRFEVPPITAEDVVNNVCHNKGGWKTLQQVHTETLEARRQKKLSDRYEMVLIPLPVFDPEDRDL